MFGNVTALEGLHVTVEIQARKHDAHMRQACGLGSSQGGVIKSPSAAPRAVLDVREGAPNEGAPKDEGARP